MNDSRYIELFAATELEPGEMKAVEVEGIGRLAVYNVDGDWYATSDVCSHGNASLADGLLEGCTVICPFHAGAFDVRTGCPVAYPATVPVRSYSLALMDGKVYIDVEQNAVAAAATP